MRRGADRPDRTGVALELPDLFARAGIEQVEPEEGPDRGEVAVQGTRQQGEAMTWLYVRS